MTLATAIGPDGERRCRWCIATPEYIAYHDAEWGFPVGDDRRLFEKLSLEGFQAGLSWRTILAKRERFRTVFHHFDYERIARFGARDVERLLQDSGIVRHRGKIEAVIHNAHCAQELLAREGSLAAFIWRYEPERRRAPSTAATSPESVALSKALKRLGWRFVGPTTVYAFMQAMGLVNDHAHGCVIRADAERARERFSPPALSAPAKHAASARRPRAHSL
ncbi:MAG: DNA-3-methyladenine glycosylase I [Steroidobacteraceae bacterium]